MLTTQSPVWSYVSCQQMKDSDTKLAIGWVVAFQSSSRRTGVSVRCGIHDKCTCRDVGAIDCVGLFWQYDTNWIAVVSALAMGNNQSYLDEHGYIKIKEIGKEEFGKETIVKSPKHGKTAVIKEVSMYLVLIYSDKNYWIITHTNQQLKTMDQHVSKIQYAHLLPLKGITVTVYAYKCLITVFKLCNDIIDWCLSFPWY